MDLNPEAKTIIFTEVQEVIQLWVSHPPPPPHPSPIVVTYIVVRHPTNICPFNFHLPANPLMLNQLLILG